MEDIIIYDKLPTKFGFGKVIKIKENKNLYVEFKDENNKEFYKYRKLEDVIFLNYIGLKDINNRKIYADSSIVEFDYLVDFESDVFQKRIGVFYFEKTFLAYHIAFLSGKNRKGGNADRYNAFGMKNFKITDTIQDNKLKLIA